MSEKSPLDLSRRERQIMAVIYRLGRATAAEVLAELSDPPSYSAVRAHLRILEEKGHLAHRPDGPRYVYFPTLPREEAREGALKHLVQTFFDGSASQAMAALLETREGITPRELEQLSRLIEKARKEGR